MVSSRLVAAKGCEVAGFALGRHVYAIRQHPGMPAGFFLALTEEFAAQIGQGLERPARASPAEPADTDAFAEALARFFEQAERSLPA